MSILKTVIAILIAFALIAVGSCACSLLCVAVPLVGIGEAVVASAESAAEAQVIDLPEEPPDFPKGQDSVPERFRKWRPPQDEMKHGKTRP